MGRAGSEADFQGQARVSLEVVIQPIGVDPLDAQHVPECLDKTNLIDSDRFGERAVNIEDGEVHTTTFVGG
jgi:hypothetical protein